MEKIDLHLHTQFSDGQLDVLQMLNKLKENDIYKVAITDHDSIINTFGIKKLYQHYGIEVIPAIEFNVNHNNMHLLGYGIKDIDLVNKKLNDIKRQNYLACLKTIDLLEEHNVEITRKEVLKVLKNERFNILSSLEEERKNSNLEDKKIFDNLIQNVSESNLYMDKRTIVKWLLKNGYVRSIIEAYNIYLGKNGICYVPINKINKYECIDLINKAGGVAVLAHPLTLGYDNLKTKDIIIDLQNKGLEGVEVFGTKMSKERQQFFTDVCDELKLLKTGGSDFHTQGDDMGIYCEKSVWNNLNIKIKQKQLL